MLGPRFLHRPVSILTALILWGACQACLTGMGAEPVTTPTTAPAAVSDKTHIVINIPSRTLWVYSGDRIVRYFPVGVGRVGYMTPLGKFSVIRKVVDPGWENPYLPNGQVRLAPGEDNPLGTRWIGFYQKDNGEYGMHGTDNPTSVGKFSSHGCVRMKVKDAEALFDLVDVGTPVEVVYQPVLIRKQDNNVRVVVFADRFQRGMPGPEQVKANILKQYPNATVNINALKSALQSPTEHPVNVGGIPEAEETAVESTTAQASPEPAQTSGQPPQPQTDLNPMESKENAAPTAGQLNTPPQPRSTVQETSPKATPAPLNPQQFFHPETSKL